MARAVAGAAIVADFGGRPGRFFAGLDTFDGRTLLETGNLLSQLCSTILAGIETILRTCVRFTNVSISLKNAHSCNLVFTFLLNFNEPLV